MDKVVDIEPYFEFEIILVIYFLGDLLEGPIGPRLYTTIRSLELY